MPRRKSWDIYPVTKNVGAVKNEEISERLATKAWGKGKFVLCFNKASDNEGVLGE
jgi:hypothetical protein